MEDLGPDDPRRHGRRSEQRPPVPACRLPRGQTRSARSTRIPVSSPEFGALAPSEKLTSAPIVEQAEYRTRPEPS